MSIDAIIIDGRCFTTNKNDDCSINDCDLCEVREICDFAVCPLIVGVYLKEKL